MTARSLLKQGYDKLFYAEVETPLLDAVVLLAHASAQSKEQLLASLPDRWDAGAEEAFHALIDRRCAGIPVSYLRGRRSSTAWISTWTSGCWFRGRIPRSWWRRRSASREGIRACGGFTTPAPGPGASGSACRTPCRSWR